MWGRRWSKMFFLKKLPPFGGYTHTQSCGGVLVEQAIPKTAGVLVLVLRSFLLLAADRYIKIYLWSAVIPSMHTGGISHMTFLRLRVPRAWSVCVLSLRSQFVLSLRGFLGFVSGSIIIFSEFARSSIGNFSRFAHASSSFLDFDVHNFVHFSPLRRRFEWLSRASLGLRLHFSTVPRLLNAALLAIVNAQLSV